MKLKIIPTESFKRDVKRLKKKYPRLTGSLKELNKALYNGEFGVAVGSGANKKMVKNVDLQKGKSGGFRAVCSHQTRGIK